MAEVNDTFISDEEEDLCPLCVEEMDLSDKNFKPCPCGYQICQFCYNNIISNPDLNHRCPACRRIYSKDTVEYKVLSPEELNALKLKQLEKERKRKQKEKERKDAEQASKKHLAGMRVIQKNLVYVVGLNPPGNPEDLHALLRSDSYFGQYGKISKIVINRKQPNPANPHSNPGLSVYVTFVKKEDALKCIQAVDGSISDGRVLKAAHGTTKYCSSYLRGQPCPNPNCMFLHEPGEEADSYTREGLSSRRINIAQARSAVHGLIPASTTPVNGSSPTTRLHSIASSTNLNGAHNTPTTPTTTTTTNNNNNSMIFDTSNNNNNISNGGNYGMMPEDDENNTSTLPATAAWGKAGSSTNLHAMNGGGNGGETPELSSFPTLVEAVQSQQGSGSFREYNKKREKHKGLLSSSDDILNEYFDSNLYAVTVSAFIEESLKYLNSLDFNNLNLRFKNSMLDETYYNSLPALFRYNNKQKRSTYTTEELDAIVRNSVDSLLSNKLDSEENSNLSQQSQQQPQQQQHSQPPQQQPHQQPPQQSQERYMQPQPQRVQPIPQHQQQSVTPFSTVAELVNNNQQQQQQQQQQQARTPQELALLQHQQQLYQQQLLSQQQQSHKETLLKMNQGGTATPPPPGLFNNAQRANVNIGHNNVSNNNIDPQIGASSELLNHLLSGKKIVA
ncbi:hypothetical protein PACTADRAFT_47670 [Pachysolen tannophilus NRRL Y-2460]|uniref:RING-type domain-containing protein n=1 Tax=Pachysolen tannophilus NRRL Y-2460 TaxID=669874 RepID=A0A1E4U1F8_PACTA|nr:hypothetical protein PACTADRAFT_47670 [Pachysolen tannophilus NRRL Y-2460]